LKKHPGIHRDIDKIGIVDRINSIFIVNEVLMNDPFGQKVIKGLVGIGFQINLLFRDEVLKSPRERQKDISSEGKHLP